MTMQTIVNTLTPYVVPESFVGAVLSRGHDAWQSIHAHGAEF